MNWELFQGSYFVFQITTFYMEFLIFILKPIDYNTFSFYNIVFWDTFMLVSGSAIVQDSKSEKF